mmetsp:Transcript_4515/g.10217  ORF Transcript_4515/g.10217 Transcript_4515/m.10217 type:complete len:243 (-) Transcript_4515:1088-1816(-)
MDEEKCHDSSDGAVRATDGRATDITDVDIANITATADDDDADRADEAAGNIIITNNTNPNEDKERGNNNNNDSRTCATARKPSMAMASNTITKSSSSNSNNKRPSSRPSLQRSNSSSIHKSFRDVRQNLHRQSSQSFRALKRQSSTIFESINHNLIPASPSVWALFMLSAASIGLQYELHLQKELTAPPIVFCQEGKRSVLNERMDRIYDKLLSKTSIRASKNKSTNSSKPSYQQQQTIFIF